MVDFLNDTKFFKPDQHFRPVGVYKLMDDPGKPVFAVVAQHVPEAPAMERHFPLSATDLAGARGKNQHNDAVIAQLTKQLADVQSGMGQFTPYTRPADLPRAVLPADYALS